MKIRLQLLIAAIFLASGTGLSAQFVWTGSGATGSVSDAGNWQAHVPAVPVGDGSEDLVFGPLVGSQFTALFPTMAINNLSVTSTVDLYYISGSGGSPVLTINGNVSTAAGSSLYFENNLGISLSAGSHGFAAGGSIEVDSNLSGAGGLVVAGTGTVDLSGVNSYTGGTTIDQGGRLTTSGTINHPAANTVVGLTAGAYGELDINPGGHVTDSLGRIGLTDPTTNGVVYVSGAGALWTNNTYLYVGELGTGTLFIQNGGTVASANTSIGNNTGGSGFVEISSASTMTNTGNLYVGSAGTGMLDIIQGSTVTNVNGSIGNNPGGNGNVDVNGAGSIWNNTGDLTVGGASTGFLTIENGALVHSANGYLATQPTITGDVLVTDPGTLWNVSNALYVGYAGNGVLALYAGGTVAVAGGNGTIFLGYNSGATGQLVIGQGVGTGGTVNATTITTLNGTGTVTFYNDDTSANPYFLTKDGTGFGTPVTIAGPTTVFGQSGYTVLAGNNTYTGGTTIIAGTVVATNSSAFGTGPVTLAAPTATVGVASGQGISNTLNLANGGTLIGSGTFSTPITLGLNTTVSPGLGGVFGTGIGGLLFSQGLTLANGGTYAFQIQQANGVLDLGYDSIQLTGGVLNISGGPFTIDVLSLDSLGNPGAVADFLSTSSYSWTLFSSPGGINNFSAADFVIDASGFTNSLGTGSFSVVQSGNEIQLDFAPVPEPATYALLAAGLGLVGWVIRRRRAAHA